MAFLRFQSCRNSVQERGVIRRTGFAYIGLGQIGIGAQIEPGRAALDAAEDELLDGIEAGRSQLDGIFDGIGDKVFVKHLNQPQHLDDLAFAAVAHAGFKPPPQMQELLGSNPALQRPRLIQGAGLLLDQRQIMQRIADKGAVLVGALMPGDLLAAASDHNRVGEAFHDDGLVAIGGRDGVIACPVAHQRG